MHAQSASSETIGEVLTTAIATLERAGVSEARVNAELLLAHLLDTDRGGVFVRRSETLPQPVARRYAEWLARRASREPLQHVIGTQEFYGREFISDARALVPRPETEGLVEAVLRLDLPQGARVADLGTGSGCIALTLALERLDFSIDALEISPRALSLARENAELHDVGARVRFTEGDQAAPPPDWRGVMHLVVCNPPYARAAEWEELAPEVRDHDPRQAVVAGPSGLEAYRALVPRAFDLLRPGGTLGLELGFGQADAVTTIVTGAGFREVTVRPDLCGIERVLLARRPPSGEKS